MSGKPFEAQIRYACLKDHPNKRPRHLLGFRRTDRSSHEQAWAYSVGRNGAAGLQIWNFADEALRWRDAGGRVISRTVTIDADMEPIAVKEKAPQFFAALGLNELKEVGFTFSQTCPMSFEDHPGTWHARVYMAARKSCQDEALRLLAHFEESEVDPFGVVFPPLSFDAEKLQAAARAGVNRPLMHQSWVTKELATNAQFGDWA